MGIQEVISLLGTLAGIGIGLMVALIVIFILVGLLERVTDLRLPDWLYIAAGTVFGLLCLIVVGFASVIVYLDIQSVIGNR